MSLSAATRLGPYEIVAPLGAGGMGEVYRARDTRLDRQVAIKVLTPRYFSDQESRSRLEREARIVARLNHPNICTLHDMGDEGGLVYLVFECLEGSTLEALLARGPIPIHDLIDYATGITDALDAAHAKGVIHRDIKPANIYISRSGIAKVLDFGLAKHGAQNISQSLRTETFESKTTAGTAGYMSPEQVLGRELDGRSDLFSLGIVLYRAATGRAPFLGETAGEVSDAILHKTPIPPSRLNPAVPLALEQIILKALEKQVDLRYQSAAEMRTDLKRLKRDSESAIDIAVPAQPAPRMSRVIWAAAAVVVVLIAVLSIVLLRKPPAAPVPQALTQRQLTANPAELPVHTAAISADGKHLAYSDSSGFYIRLLESGETDPLKLPPGFCFR